MTARWVTWLTLAAAGCTHAQAPHLRRAGEVAALGGVAGVIASALAASVTTHARPFVIGFSLVSGAGILAYAGSELTDPSRGSPPAETLMQRNRRWARILTERAAGAAREGRCARVRRLEIRVRDYDPETHDFVFMRDPEILRCMPSP